MWQRNWRLGMGLAVALTVLAVGCRPQQPFYLHEDGDLSHYVDKATEIEYPDVEPETLAEVDQALPPLTVDNNEVTEYWDLPLEEAVHIALKNSKVFRTLQQAAIGAPREPESSLTLNPAGVGTIYDPAIQESDPRFGVEGALSAFDAQLSTQLFWQQNDTPQNVAGFVTEFRPRAFRQDLGGFEAQLSKTYATGGTWSLSHTVDYEWNNAGGSREWPSDWTANLQAGFRQPLLQGAGVTFNRIAGPQSAPGSYSGVLLARTEEDQRLVEFEMSAQNLLLQVEQAYWTLYLAYRQLNTALTARDASLQTWRQVRAKYEVGGRGGSAQEEAQAREQYLAFRAAVEQSLSNLYKAENNLRYLMGLAATDGRLIRPADEPSRARVKFDFYEAHAEAMVRNPNLRREKWRVKRAELELIAAKNFLLPRLDAFGFYRWDGIGDDMLDSSNATSNAYGSLTSGKYQNWQIGLDLTIPLGFRKEMAAVRNAQLQLARERALLQEQELEVSHQIAWVLREIDEFYQVAETNYNRAVASYAEVQAVSAMYDTGTATLDLLLNAQQRRAQAEIEYFQSITKYMFAISQLHFRKGTLLEYNGVFLTEGPWPHKAYFDALRRARARDAGHYLNYGITNPPVFSRGEYQQHPGTVNGADDQLIGTYEQESGGNVPQDQPMQISPLPEDGDAGESSDSAPGAGPQAARRVSEVDIARARAAAEATGRGIPARSAEPEDSPLSSLSRMTGKSPPSMVQPVAYQRIEPDEPAPSAAVATGGSGGAWRAAGRSPAGASTGGAATVGDLPK